MLDEDAEHYNALHNLDYYDAQGRGPSLRAWLMSESEYEKSRSKNLSMNMAAHSSEWLRRHRERTQAASRAA